VRAYAAWEPRPYDGRVTLFFAEETAKGDPAMPERWGALCARGVRVVPLPGDHFTAMMGAAAPGGLAERLRDVLREVA
jgi:thioesterase domain-containing protein